MKPIITLAAPNTMYVYMHCVSYAASNSFNVDLNRKINSAFQGEVSVEGFIFSELKNEFK